MSTAPIDLSFCQVGVQPAVRRVERARDSGVLSGVGLGFGPGVTSEVPWWQGVAGRAGRERVVPCCPAGPTWWRRRCGVAELFEHAVGDLTLQCADCFPCGFLPASILVS